MCNVRRHKIQITLALSFHEIARCVFYLRRQSPLNERKNLFQSLG